jgi:hypothetical protein
MDSGPFHADEYQTPVMLSEDGIHCKEKDKVLLICTMDPAFAGMNPDFVTWVTHCQSQE